MQAFGNRTAATGSGDANRRGVGHEAGSGRSGDVLPPETRGAASRRPVARRTIEVVDADFETLPARTATQAVYPVYPVFNDNSRDGRKKPDTAHRGGLLFSLAAIEARLRAMPTPVFALGVVALVTGSFYASAGINAASSGVAAPASLSVTTLRSDATGTTLLTVSSDREITQRHTPPPTITVDVIAGGKTISTTRVLAE